MGTWGPGSFDDDTTCDARGHYRRALRAGVPGSEVTDQIIGDYASGPDRFDSHGLVWLGRAATQAPLAGSRSGSRQGLGGHRRGADLAAWVRWMRRRAAAGGRPLCGCGAGCLARSHPVQLKPPWHQDTTLQSGQHLLVRFPDGQRVLLRVLDVQAFSLEATEGTCRW